MRYEVPQFIDIEDKLFGPLTFKQFIYLVGGAGMCYVFYHFLPIYVAFFFILPVGALALALAFYKLNTRPFIEVLQSFVVYIFSSKSFLWKRTPKTAPQSSSAPKPAAQAPQKLPDPAVSERRISDLSKSLDLLDRDQISQ